MDTPQYQRAVTPTVNDNVNTTQGQSKYYHHYYHHHYYYITITITRSSKG